MSTPVAVYQLYMIYVRRCDASGQKPALFSDWIKYN